MWFPVTLRPKSAPASKVALDVRPHVVWAVLGAAGGLLATLGGGGFAMNGLRVLTVLSPVSGCCPHLRLGSHQPLCGWTFHVVSQVRGYRFFPGLSLVAWG